MQRFIKVSAIMAVLLAALLAALVFARLQPFLSALLAPAPQRPSNGGPVPPQDDLYPMLPPMSALERLPSAEIAAEWGKIQRRVMDEAQSKIRDPKLPRRLWGRYQDIISETSKRMSWVSMICMAHDSNLDECMRRNCILNLQGYEAYLTGHWPDPVPSELIAEAKAQERMEVKEVDTSGSEPSRK
jgi:hypothetical protein